jgi:uncharacterized protein YukE
MPGGDPGVLDALADALDRHAGEVTDLAGTTRSVTAQVRSDADWTGQAASAYTEFTSALARGIGRAAPPLSQIASAVRGYASALRVAQRQVTAYGDAVRQAQASGSQPAAVQAAQAAEAQAGQACASCQAAGDEAAAQVRAAAGTLNGIFAPEGALRGVIEKIHTALGAAGADGILWAMGKGAEQAGKFAKDLPELEVKWLQDRLAASVWGQDATQEEVDAAVGGWWAKADAAEAFGAKFVADTKLLGLVSRIGRVGGGPIALAGDVSTVFNPPQSGVAGWADRGAAGANGVAVGIDTAGAAGQLLGVEALADVSLGPIGAGIAVGTGLYLAGAYAYKHWAWFRQDLAQPIGHGVVDATRDLAHGAADVGHDVASWF